MSPWLLDIGNWEKIILPFERYRLALVEALSLSLSFFLSFFPHSFMLQILELSYSGALEAQVENALWWWR